MSRSHRRHEAPGRSAKRGPKTHREARTDTLHKTHKQTRPRTRTALRKEYR